MKQRGVAEDLSYGFLRGRLLYIITDQMNGAEHANN